MRKFTENSGIGRGISFNVLQFYQFYVSSLAALHACTTHKSGLRRRGVVLLPPSSQAVRLRDFIDTFR